MESTVSNHFGNVLQTIKFERRWWAVVRAVATQGNTQASSKTATVSLP